ncbi:MAG: hypothetical protein ACM3TT_10320 [Syntrophothermus sp.]
MSNMVLMFTCEEVSNKIFEHVISHLFEVHVDSLDSSCPPQSLEPHIEFYWAKPTQESLAFHKVLPEPVQEMIPKVRKEGVPLWVSTMEN